MTYLVQKCWKIVAEKALKELERVEVQNEKLLKALCNQDTENKRLVKSNQILRDVFSGNKKV